ncbi:hypothetical protein [Mycoplasma crocodyli]|uniref:Uncharacterized protein n=1 Tax=Mycoplasma crocodyli (strain ATCC 51981 / MP145) TaxID=512564 RepID=D5E5G6_MYCCM|nr:hypothetical protein [Mycoplasma crocodyli]ADE19819.1 conserved hypothetical protein [Mycoplasma crocodyli MP145]
MKQGKFNKIFYIVFFGNFSIVNLILISLWSINYALFLGFTVGALSSYLLYEVNTLCIYLIYKGKKSAIFLGMTKFIINMSLVAVILIISLLINKSYITINKLNKYPIDAPINIFAYIFGITLIPISLLFSNSIYNYKKKRGKDGYY